MDIVEGWRRAGAHLLIGERLGQLCAAIETGPERDVIGKIVHDTRKTGHEVFRALRWDSRSANRSHCPL